MNQRTLKILSAAVSSLIIIVVIALLVNRKTDAPEVETIPKRTVGAHIVVEEETTHEPETTTPEETTVANLVASAFSVDPVQETTEAETEVPSYTIEEMAAYVLDEGLNGDARKEALGDNYEAVQKWLDENYVPPVREYIPEAEGNGSGGGGDYFPTGGDILTPSAGVNYYNGIMETYYNLPMGGVCDIMYALGYSGEYWVRFDGVKMFGPYVMVAADFGWLPRGSLVECSLGTAMVCDTGSGGYGWLDIAVTW